MDEWMDGWMNGGMDGWIDGWIDGWMDGWIDGWMSYKLDESSCLDGISCCFTFSQNKIKKIKWRQPLKNTLYS